MTNLFENISNKNIEKLKKMLKTNTIKYHKNVSVLSNFYNKEDFIALIDIGSVQIVFNDYDGNKTEQIQEMGKTLAAPGRQQEPEGSEQSQRKLRMFERALGNFSNEEQSLIYYRYYKGLNSKDTGLMLGISRAREEKMEKRVKNRLKRLQRNLGVLTIHCQFEHQYYRRH